MVLLIKTVNEAHHGLEINDSFVKSFDMNRKISHFKSMSVDCWLKPSLSIRIFLSFIKHEVLNCRWWMKLYLVSLISRNWFTVAHLLHSSSENRRSQPSQYPSSRTSLPTLAHPGQPYGQVSTQRPRDVDPPAADVTRWWRVRVPGRVAVECWRVPAALVNRRRSVGRAGVDGRSAVAAAWRVTIRRPVNKKKN